MTERPWFTLKLRLPFARWSQAVDKNGLVAVRAWIKEVSDQIAASKPID